MTNIKTVFKSFLLSCLFFVASSLIAVSAQAAPRLYFDPNSANPSKDSDFQVTIKIDVEDKTAFGADATVVYPSSDVTLKSISSGGFFTDFSYAPSDGRIEIHSFMSAQFASKTGSGDFAKLTFTTKKDTGTGAVSFICTSDNETQILDTSGVNILNCGNINQLNLTFAGSSPYPPGYSEPNACGGTCGSNYNCAAPLYCYQGFCRNPNCRTDLTCGCKATPVPAKKATPKPPSKGSSTPEVVVLSEFTPFPSSVPSPETLPIEPTTQRGSLDVRTFGILTGVGIFIVAIILMLLSKARKKNPPKINPPTSGQENPVIGYPPPPPTTPTPPATF